MKLLKKYTNIENFLYRFTIFCFKNVSLRIHKIVNSDQTTLLHNHPFNYISFVLKGGYDDVYLENDVLQTTKRKRFSFLKRDHSVYHRIENVMVPTYTLFFIWGKYSWKALNLKNDNDKVIMKRIVNGKEVFSKRENGIWYIGNENREIAEKETRHSIHQKE